jgi:endonuclease YncB( thermonuclease family)
LDKKSSEIHTYKAILDRVVDGDTIHVTLDLGFEIRHKEILRLAKISAPEMSTSAGKKSAEILQKILKDVKVLVVKTNKTDIYGRYLADVFFSENGEEDLQKIADFGVYLSQRLIDLGAAEEF